MAANGYGVGNLPMDLYKMVTYDRWVYGTRADGQGDYSQWGIYRIAAHAYLSTNDGRAIVSPTGFAAAVLGDDYNDNMEIYHEEGEDNMTVFCGFFRWAVDGSYLYENFSEFLYSEDLHSDEWEVDFYDL